MTKADKLFLKVQELEKELWTAKDALRDCEDGFYYKTTSYCHGHKIVREFNNSYCLKEFIEDSGDGENYIITKLETDNPDWENWSSGYEEYHEEDTEKSTKEYYDYSDRRPRRLRRPRVIG